MREELIQQVAALLAGGLEDEADDLDSLENQLIPALREVGRRALQQKLAGKKRATRAAASPADAGEKPAL
jgi:hypothetical protein